MIDAHQRTYQIGLTNRAFPSAQQVASVKEGRIGPGGFAYLAGWKNDHLSYLKIKSEPKSHQRS